MWNEEKYKTNCGTVGSGSGISSHLSTYAPRTFCRSGSKCADAADYYGCRMFEMSYLNTGPTVLCKHACGRKNCNGRRQQGIPCLRHDPNGGRSGSRTAPQSGRPGQNRKSDPRRKNAPGKILPCALGGFLQWRKKGSRTELGKKSPYGNVYGHYSSTGICQRTHSSHCRFYRSGCTQSRSG